MTISWFSKRLNPELKIRIFKDGKAVGAVTAKLAADSKWADMEIKDFRMSSFKLEANVEIF